MVLQIHFMVASIIPDSWCSRLGSKQQNVTKVMQCHSHDEVTLHETPSTSKLTFETVLAGLKRKSSFWESTHPM